MDHTPSDGHRHPNFENAADLKQWRSFSFQGTWPVFVLIWVITMSRVR
jgi:hypothetical protein